MKLRKSVRREKNLLLLKQKPVLLLQHAAFSRYAWQYAVVCAEQEQRADRVAVVARHLADIDRIERDGDRTHTVLCENEPEQTQKLLCVQHAVVQNFNELIHHIAKDRPKLRRLLGALTVAACKKRLRLLPERFGKSDLLEISIERGDLLTGRSRAAHAGGKVRKRQAHALPQRVDLRKTLLRRFVPKRAVAVRMRGPRRLAKPHAAADIPLEHIIFQKVAFLAR